MTTMEERFRQRQLEEKIEAITKERDEALEQNTLIDARCAKLEAASRLALAALNKISKPEINLDFGERLSAGKAIQRLQEAGVQ